MITAKPRLAVYKFTSCDGCQLAFLNAGEMLLTLSTLVDIVHFPEYGTVSLDPKVDIAFIEGSISTPAEQDLIQKIRGNSQFIVTIGACATTGGIQALRNYADSQEWVEAIYAVPQYIESLSTSTAISHHIKVDCELWGCPVNTHQVMDAVRSLLFNATPRIKRDPVCLSCKQKQNICVMVTKNKACLGPVTQTGCGALCPSIGRACYGCYGPMNYPNTKSLGDWFSAYSHLSDEEIALKFRHINSQAKAFKEADNYFKGIKIKNE